MADSLPNWERELLDKQAAEQCCEAALQAADAILRAYDHGILLMNARYLADTLRMVLGAIASVKKHDGTPS